MKPAPVGTRIRVLRNSNNHSYRIGSVYTVYHDDRDGTLKATDETGRVGNWLRWEDCDLAGPSVWERIAADLPEDLVRFLACFDGINALVIKERVIDTVLAGVRISTSGWCPWPTPRPAAWSSATTCPARPPTGARPPPPIRIPMTPMTPRN